MTKKEIIHYFKELSILFPYPARVILTGAVAGSIYGGVRATMDIDFSLEFKTHLESVKRKLWEEFRRATERVHDRTKISAQYAEDIDRWSSITYLDYKNHTKTFRKFGTIEVKILDPAYWAIGKFARFLLQDERDLVQVLKKTKTNWKLLCRILGQALRKSPKSTVCFQFRNQVENFLKIHGREIWGKEFSVESAVHLFRQSAGIRQNLP